MRNRWVIGLGTLTATSLACITLAPLVAAEPITSLTGFTSPTPNSSYHRGESITLRLTQTTSMHTSSGYEFPSVSFTSDTGCVRSMANSIVYSGVDVRDVVITTPVLPGAQPGPCTITGQEDGGARDVASVTVEIVETPAVTAPGVVAGNDVTNPTTTLPGVSSVTVTPGLGAATTVPAPQVAGVTVSPNEVAGASLPRTGSSTAAQLWLGVLLLGVGALFTAMAKRSQRSRES